MRQLNSKIKVDFISEKGFDINDKTYFAYVPLENMVCYAVAESCDNYSSENSAEIAVKSVLESFERNPSFRNLKQYIKKAHRILRKKRLEASITVVISDYVKIKYASCGNVKFYLLNNDAIELESKTHSYIYKNLNYSNLSADKLPIHELRNLSQHLGQKKPIRFSTSKKTELSDGCTMLFVTVNIWEVLDNVEILDAYMNSENFVDCIQSLYIPAEQEASVVGSYTIASLFVEKVFKENKSKKKKRRIAIIIAIILVILCTIIYYLDRQAVRRIRNLDIRGVEYLDHGRYDMIFAQYDEANTRTNALRLRWLHRGEKNVLSATIPLIRELSHNIVTGDAEFEIGNYENAYSLYRDAQGLIFNLSKDADLNSKFSPRIFDALDKIEKYIEMKLEKTEKYVEVIRLIRDANNRIIAGNYLDALSKCNDATRAVANIENLEHRDSLMERINNEKMKIVAWVEEKGLNAAERLSNGDFDGAIIIYEEMMQLYIELGEISKSAEVRDKINDVNSERRLFEDGISIDSAEAYIRSGDIFLSVNDFGNAISQYNLARSLYTRLRMSEETRLMEQKINEVQEKRDEMEIAENILVAEILESEGDFLLISGNFTEANNKYRQAQIIYQSFNQLSKAMALNDKISNLNDMKAASQEATASENNRNDLMTEWRYFEQLGDNFVNQGEFERALESYNMVLELYLSAGEIDSALAVFLKLREIEIEIEEDAEEEENLQTLLIEENLMETDSIKGDSNVQ